MLPLIASTELEAINIMLSTIGETPVNTLVGADAQVDTQTAVQILREITVAVQQRGWNFNTEVNWPLTPDGSGFLQVPTNAIQVEPYGVSEYVDATVRGSRMYNRETRSYVWTSGLTVKMIVLLDYTEIPEAARNYITIRAARVFQQRILGSETLGSFTARDELFALSALKKLDSNNADYNILSGSWSVARILLR